MRYVVMTTDGGYQVPPGTEADRHAALGTTNPARVELAPLPNNLGTVTGWINPAAVDPNPVGEEVLLALGATPDTYLGTIVITGWDPVTEQVRGVHSDQAGVIQQLHADASNAP